MAMSKLAKDQLKFVDPPADEFNCPICLGILQEPYLTACCGNHFCEACIEKVKEGEKEGANKCPLCQETPLNGMINKSLRRKLNELKVYCIHKETGCKWVGDLGKLEQHLAIGEIKGECQFVVVTCTVSDLCKVQTPRRSFTNHVNNVCNHRQFRCRYCGHQHTYIAIITKHYDQCPKYPLNCPNNCSKQTYPRGQLDTHLALCPEQIVDCTFSEMGCREKLKRRQLQQHLETNLLQHQIIMCTTIKLLQKDKQELQKQVGILKKKESAMAVKESNWPLYLHKMSQIALETPILFEIPFTITRKSRCALGNNGHRGNYCFAPTYHSPLFYSHPNGYRLQLVAKFMCHCSWCLAGFLKSTNPSREIVDTDGKICSVSIDFYIVNGEYDTNLKWPFEGQIAVSLLNKLADSNHLKKEKYYKGKHKSDGASQLIISQDNSIKQLELYAEYNKLLQKKIFIKDRIRNLHENAHALHNPNSLLFPFDGDLTFPIESKLYFKVALNIDCL